MRMARLIGLVGLSVLVLAGMGSPSEASAQAVIDFSGEWLDNSFESDDRGGPPRLGLIANGYDSLPGNLLGLPYNDAGRQKAATSDMAIYSHPAWIFRPHPIQYSMRGFGLGSWRMIKEIDPETGRLLAYRVTGGYNLDRLIWMDGRERPPDYAEHTYTGFSTGRFERDMLVVTTTHIKHGYHRRNGSPASDQTRMTEYFIRHGDRMTHVQFTEDPIYLEEPLVRTTDHIFAPTRQAGTFRARSLWNTGEEVMWDEGYLPHYTLGTPHTQISDWLGIPYETTWGGSETLYPEYREKLRQLMSESGGAR